LADLPGAENEAKAISDELNGNLVLASEATEKIFKEYASRYHLLHLAMHTYIDEQNPLFTKLIFSNSTDTLDDGYLNMYEVYGLNLNAKLVIISACRSGDGNLIKGEGLLSLARGFQYAGCPALVAAQWRIDDFSGSEVMVNFAKNLKSGMSKSIALQRAQAKYIGNADPLRSHPYFWASYQVIGDDNPLFISKNLKIVFWVFLSLFTLLGSWHGLKFYKSKRLKRF
jgi:CHAT domain-containing protein